MDSSVGFSPRLYIRIILRGGSEATALEHPDRESCTVESGGLK